MKINNSITVIKSHKPTKISNLRISNSVAINIKNGNIFSRIMSRHHLKTDKQFLIKELREFLAIQMNQVRRS